MKLILSILMVGLLLVFVYGVWLNGYSKAVDDAIEVMQEEADKYRPERQNQQLETHNQ